MRRQKKQIKQNKIKSPFPDRRDDAIKTTIEDMQKLKMDTIYKAVQCLGDQVALVLLIENPYEILEKMAEHLKKTHTKKPKQTFNELYDSYRKFAFCLANMIGIGQFEPVQFFERFIEELKSMEQTHYDSRTPEDIEREKEERKHFS